MAKKKKPNYESIIADLHAELGNTKEEVKILRTGVRYTLDRLATFNRGLATRPITDGDRMALMIVDGIVAPLKVAAFKTGEFIPQKKEE